jgi:hypothetical protein
MFNHRKRTGLLNYIYIVFCFFLCHSPPPQWVRASSFTRFLDHTQRRTTVGRTPPDELSARRRDLYLTTRDTHNRETSMTSVGFEPTVSEDERTQTYALDRAASGTGTFILYRLIQKMQIGKFNIHYPMQSWPCCRYFGGNAASIFRV